MHTIAMERLGIAWPEEESSSDSVEYDWETGPDGFEREETMPETTPQQEAELIAGFVSRRSENPFLLTLSPFLRQEIRRNFPSLWEWAPDLLQSAFLRLCELREDPREAKRIQPPLAELARYLLNAPARVLLRTKKITGQSLPLSDWDGARPPDQQASTRLQELMRLTSRLPAKLATVLHLHAAHELGEGPPLAEALGITRGSARRKLLEAQDALLTLSREVDDD